MNDGLPPEQGRLPLGGVVDPAGGVTHAGHHRQLAIVVRIVGFQEAEHGQASEVSVRAL